MKVKEFKKGQRKILEGRRLGGRKMAAERREKAKEEERERNKISGE